MEDHEQDGADVRRRRRRGNDRPVVRRRAALPPLLPGESDTQERAHLPAAGSLTALLVCQATGLGGMAVAGHDADQVETMTPIKERIVKVAFNADTHASIQWNFRPQQTEIYVRSTSCCFTSCH